MSCSAGVSLEELVELNCDILVSELCEFVKAGQLRSLKEEVVGDGSTDIGRSVERGTYIAARLFLARHA